jgi:hypothetical protein
MSAFGKLLPILAHGPLAGGSDSDSAPRAAAPAATTPEASPPEETERRRRTMGARYRRRQPQGRSLMTGTIEPLGGYD